MPLTSYSSAARVLGRCRSLRHRLALSFEIGGVTEVRVSSAHRLYFDTRRLPISTDCCLGGAYKLQLLGQSSSFVMFMPVIVYSFARRMTDACGFAPSLCVSARHFVVAGMTTSSISASYFLGGVYGLVTWPCLAQWLHALPFRPDILSVLDSLV